MPFQQADNNGITSRVKRDLPDIIPEDRHPIRLKDIDKDALKILFRLRDAGHVGYLVGGGVRDLYLGKQPKDFDISTDARPGQLRKLFRNSRTIGRRFRLVQVFFRGGNIIEVSTFRSQGEFDINGVEQVLPSNNTFGTPREDAFRRDLTINSLFYEVEHKAIIDYAGGVRDLEQGIIRIIGDPDRRMKRDPVRMLRAIRHAARNNFVIEENTWNAIVRNRDKLDLCPPSRIRDEVLKDLSGGASERWAEIAMQSGLFSVLFPFYRNMLSNVREGGVENKVISLLGVVDRILNTEQEGKDIVIPDYFLLTVLLLPWAEKRYNIMVKSAKGSAHYRMTRKIRADLNNILGERYKFKRMSQEAMTSIFVNFATLVSFEEKKGWPKWLRNKSYFTDCYRFYRLVLESEGGPPADENLFKVRMLSDRDEAAVHARQSYRNSHSRGRKGTRPAFTDKKKGVFGLRGR